MKVTDINSLEEIDNLTVKEMKELLFISFVDFKGCVEKEELKQKVIRLWKEHKNNEDKGIVISNHSLHYISPSLIKPPFLQLKWSY